MKRLIKLAKAIKRQNTIVKYILWYVVMVPIIYIWDYIITVVMEWLDKSPEGIFKVTCCSCGDTNIVHGRTSLKQRDCICLKCTYVFELLAEFDEIEIMDEMDDFTTL